MGAGVFCIGPLRFRPVRNMAESRMAVGALALLYVCASLVAIPVPRIVVKALKTTGISLVSAEHSDVCLCGEKSSCATSGSCCCAPGAHDKDALLAAKPRPTDDGPVILSINCKPPLKWFLAAVPTTLFTKPGVLSPDVGAKFAYRLMNADRVPAAFVDVPSPPPRLFA